MNAELPEFDFKVPDGYRWLSERGLVSFEPNGPLQPWHYFPRQDTFEPTKRWPRAGSRTRLVAFAKRQDSDDMACFEVSGDRVTQIVMIHGWTSEGFEVTGTFPDFWAWVRGVIDDVSEWVSLSSNS